MSEKPTFRFFEFDCATSFFYLTGVPFATQLEVALEVRRFFPITFSNLLPATTSQYDFLQYTIDWRCGIKQIECAVVSYSALAIVAELSKIPIAEWLRKSDLIRWSYVGEAHENTFCVMRCRLLQDLKCSFYPACMLNTSLVRAFRALHSFLSTDEKRLCWTRCGYDSYSRGAYSNLFLLIRISQDSSPFHSVSNNQDEVMSDSSNPLPDRTGCCNPI